MQDEDNNKTLKGDRTLVPDKDVEEISGTMIMHEDPGTLVPDHGTVTELQSDLGTMVINSDFEESTMKRHDTNPDRPKYRPLFLDHFDKKEVELCGVKSDNGGPQSVSVTDSKPVVSPTSPITPTAPTMPDKELNNLHQPHQPQPQLSPIYASPAEIQQQQQQKPPPLQSHGYDIPKIKSQVPPQQLPAAAAVQQQIRILDPKEIEHLKFLSYEELEQRFNNLEKEMEREYSEIQKRYIQKKKPIEDAIKAKKNSVIFRNNF